MNDRYTFLDTETGGIGTDVSLLTAYFLITDDKFNPIDRLSLTMKPDDGIYHVTGEALNINKINLVEHNNVAITYKQAGTELYNFLDKNKFDGKLIAAGHNVAFDVVHITDKLLSKGSWGKYVSYRCLDTCVIAKFLQMTGKLPKNMSISLSSLAEYFNINIPTGKAHEAEYDVNVCVGVLDKMLKL